jgi:DNA-directed RNA polymerase subunit RPC12/RpoP
MQTMNKTTQSQRVLEYIRETGSITQLEALKELGVMRLASRISDLKREGYNIISKPEAVVNRYGEKTYIKRYSEGGEKLMTEYTMAEWIFDDADEYGYSYKCSNCGRITMFRTKHDMSNECRNCKAKMRGKNNG